MMGLGGAAAAAAAYVKELKEHAARVDALTAALSGELRKDMALMDAQIAILDELDAAVEAGEPGPALAARVDEAQSINASIIARGEAVVLPALYALKQAYAEGSAFLRGDGPAAAAAADVVGAPAGGGAPPRSRM